jgi:hypothetical protein
MKESVCFVYELIMKFLNKLVFVQSSYIEWSELAASPHPFYLVINLFIYYGHVSV